MIEMSSTFLRALIYNVSYYCPPESLSRSPVFSIGDLLPRVPSPDISCLSNSTHSLLEHDSSLSLLEHDSRYAPPLRTVTHRRCVRLRTVVVYMHLTIRYAPPFRIGRHTRRRPISNLTLKLSSMYGSTTFIMIPFDGEYQPL